MNTATVSTPIRYTRQELRQQEEAAFRQIPGMDKLRHAAPENLPELEAQYPDAAFALNISSNLFFHDEELTNIHMKAYSSILKGDPIANVHFRYDKEMDAYHTRHNWD